MNQIIVRSMDGSVVLSDCIFSLICNNFKGSKSNSLKDLSKFSYSLNCNASAVSSGILTASNHLF